MVREQKVRPRVLRHLRQKTFYHQGRIRQVGLTRRQKAARGSEFDLSGEAESVTTGREEKQLEVRIQLSHHIWELLTQVGLTPYYDSKNT